MRSLACFFAIAVAAVAAPASAQWRMDNSIGLPQLGSVGTSHHWDRCTHEEHVFDPAESVASCDRLLAENDSRSMSGYILWFRAMRHRDAGQHAQYESDLRSAGDIFSQDVTANPRSYDGYYNRGLVAERLENYDAALADYERAAAIESMAPAPHRGRGAILFRRGDYQGASQAFDRAARISARGYSTDPGLHADRCEVRAALRTDLERGLGFCNRAVRNSDTPSSALTSRGYYFFKQGDLERAAADFARAVEEDPYNAAALYGRGVVAARQGRSAEGEADMERAREMDRIDVEYYANAGLTP